MNHIAKERAALYATDADFCRIFRQDMQSLYLLALVLTADPERAEGCFVSGLNDCSEGNQVFKDWARSWARRVVIKNAIRTVKPGAAPGLQEAESDQLRVQAVENLPAEIAALLALPAFERFVYVMALCEGYSDHDCALLLGCMRSDVLAARIRALQRTGRVVEVRDRLHADELRTKSEINKAVNGFAMTAFAIPA